jgi:exopolysaccharide biosynthesis polyprenyl glycosylphosphotransferase
MGGQGVQPEPGVGVADHNPGGYNGGAAALATPRASAAANGAGAMAIASRTHDVRRRRQPVLAFLLNRQTARRMARVTSLLALDYIGVLFALATAFELRLALGGHSSAATAWRETHHPFAFAYLVTVLMFARADLYADRPRRPGFAKIASSLFLTTVLALIFAAARGQRFNSYYIFYSSLFFGVVYVTVLRYLHTGVTGWLLERAGYRRRSLLVGSGSHIEALAHALATRARSQVEIVGYISLLPRPQNGLRSLGRLEDLPAALDRENVHEVIIADPNFPHAHAVDLVDVCHTRGVTVQVAPSTMEILFERAEFVPGQTVPLFTLRPPVFEGIDFALKRSVDLVLASVGLVLLSPILLVIGVAVKLSSRGPAIYCSTRPGIAGKSFDCLKFRTMRECADQLQAELEPLNEQSGALFKIRNDPRLTRVGRFLRRFSLDELPQLVNVVRGEMSLVGPRPLPLRDFERLEEWHKKRYLVLPGITGLWQVSGRAELDFDDLVRLDFMYLERWSVFLDLAILLKTIPAVLSRRGAF